MEKKENEKKEKEVATYKSNVANLLIVMRPTQKIIIDGQVVKKPGKAIRFNDGIYSTSNEEEKKFIESLDCFGNESKSLIITKI